MKVLYKSLKLVGLVLSLFIITSCGNKANNPIVDKFDDELKSKWSGQCDDNVYGTTFSYGYLSDLASKGVIPWLTQDAVNCVAEKAEDGVHGENGCLFITAFDELKGDCNIDMMAGVVCPDGVSKPDENGLCDDGFGGKVFPDGRVPHEMCLNTGEGDKCPTEPSGEGDLYSLTSEPDEYGVCLSVDNTTQFCPHGESPVQETYTPSAAGLFASLCSDGSRPVDGECKSSTGGQTPSTPLTPPPQEMQICSDCKLTFKVRWPQNYGTQIFDLLRSYFNKTQLASGDIYLRFCMDASCSDVKYIAKVTEVKAPSSKKEYTYTLTGVPVGTYYVQPILDTAYSKTYKSACSDSSNCPFMMDVLPMDIGAADPDTVITPNNDGAASHNPNPWAQQVEIASSGETVVPQVFHFGSFVFDKTYIQDPPKENSYLLFASSDGDKSCYVNHIRALNLNDYSIKEGLQLKLGNDNFKGVICALIPGEEKVVYAVGFDPLGNCGAYVFKLSVDTSNGLTVQQGQINSKDAIFIPNNGLSDDAYATSIPIGDCIGKGTITNDTLSPHPCNGTYAKVGTKKFLYLVEYKGAGSLSKSMPYPVMGVDLTDGKVVENGLGLSISDNNALPHRAIRGIATDNHYVYLLQASWSDINNSNDKVNKVFRFEIKPDGSLIDSNPTQAASPFISNAGTAEFRCGNSNYPPAFTGYQSGDKFVLAVGSDKEVIFYNASDGNEIGRMNLSGYGTQFTDFAFSPDGKRLYAISTCNADQQYLKVKLGIAGTPTTVDKDLAAVFDLYNANGGVPSLLYTDRDFDGDGNADGGIDLKATNIKANAMKWIEKGSGVIPNVVFTGPHIAASQKALFLRGSGTVGCGNFTMDESGLGQVADFGVYDVDTGNTVVFRDYVIWLNSPGKKGSDENPKAAGRWGYDIDESKNDLFVGALLTIAPGEEWISWRAPALAAVCGNGAKEKGEECDDGNTKDNDWCNNNCQFTTCGRLLDDCESTNGKDNITAIFRCLTFQNKDCGSMYSCTIVCKSRCGYQNAWKCIDPDPNIHSCFNDYYNVCLPYLQ